MRVLLSIKPIHVANILNGSKLFEFRRRIFGRIDVKTVVIYSTSPVKKVVGEFDIDSILSDSPNALWEKTAHGSGITRKYFDDYFTGRSQAFALAIGSVRIYAQPIELCQIAVDLKPPQSYMYLDDEIGESRLRQSQGELF